MVHPKNAELNTLRQAGKAAWLKDVQFLNVCVYTELIFGRFTYDSAVHPAKAELCTFVHIGKSILGKATQFVKAYAPMLVQLGIYILVNALQLPKP